MATRAPQAVREVRGSRRRAATRRERGTLVPLILVLAVVASAVAVVQLKQHSRELTGRLEQLKARQRKLNVEWSQLQLEQATLGGHSRVDAMARNQLGMVEPKSYVIVRVPASGSSR